MKKKQEPFNWGRTVALLILLGALGFWGVRLAGHGPSDLFKKPIDKAPDFSFTERSGRPFSSSELKGKVWVVDFIFAHCAGSCPMQSQKMKMLQEAWKGNPDLKLLSFTVDPVRDTPPFLKAYADDYHAEPDQWFFLTGFKKDLYKMIREGFKATAMESPEGGPGFDYIHTTRFYLVDAKGMIRGYYDGEKDEEMEMLRNDVRYLMGRRNKS